MSDAQPIYAHTLPGEPPEKWELLTTHAANVAQLASEFASAFGAAEWGKPLGEWHDLGKLQPDF